LHLALYPDVTDRDVVQQMPVLHHRIVVVRGQVRVVVDVVGGAPVPPGRLEVRRLPVPGAEVERGRTGSLNHRRPPRWTPCPPNAEPGPPAWPENPADIRPPRSSGTDARCPAPWPAGPAGSPESSRPA